MRSASRVGNVLAKQAVTATSRLLDIGVITRVTGTYRYDLTKACATPAAKSFSVATIIPALI